MRQIVHHSFGCNHLAAAAAAAAVAAVGYIGYSLAVHTAGYSFHIADIADRAEKMRRQVERN